MAARQDAARMSSGNAPSGVCIGLLLRWMAGRASRVGQGGTTFRDRLPEISGPPERRDARRGRNTRGCLGAWVPAGGRPSRPRRAKRFESAARGGRARSLCVRCAPCQLSRREHHGGRHTARYASAVGLLPPGAPRLGRAERIRRRLLARSALCVPGAALPNVPELAATDHAAPKLSLAFFSPAYKLFLSFSPTLHRPSIRSFNSSSKASIPSTPSQWLLLASPPRWPPSPGPPAPSSALPSSSAPSPLPALLSSVPLPSRPSSASSPRPSSVLLSSTSSPPAPTAPRWPTPSSRSPRTSAWVTPPLVSVVPVSVSVSFSVLSSSLSAATPACVVSSSPTPFLVSPSSRPSVFST